MPTVVDPTVLSKKAYYNVTYDTNVNTTSYHQNALVTYGDFQYAVFYDADGYVCVGRRPKPPTVFPWEVIKLDHQLSVNDSHNVACIGISSDGVIHLAMDTHNTPIFYYKSVDNLANDPESFNWSSPTLFGEVMTSLDGEYVGNISYPRFVRTPDNSVLQMFYRVGGSTAGTLWMAEYVSGVWNVIGQITASTGNYSTVNANSNSRNFYPHGITYDVNGTLHIAGTWREGNAAVLYPSAVAGGIPNHDVLYFYSTDNGRTWYNDAGGQIGITGSAYIGIGSVGLVVATIPPWYAMMNDESLAIDSNGWPHIILSYVPGRFVTVGPGVTNYQTGRVNDGRVIHQYRNSTGWVRDEIKNDGGEAPLKAVGRSKVVIDPEDNLYVIFPGIRVYVGTPQANWQDFELHYGELMTGAHNAFGEIVVDSELGITDGLISIMYQEKSTNGVPSALRTLDMYIQ